MGYAAFEQDVKAGLVAAHPRLYAETMFASRAAFFVETLRWGAEALWHSAVVSGAGMLIKALA